MNSTLSPQTIQNLKAQLSVWDNQIKVYSSRADLETDTFTQRALFDEIVHLQAKRDEFANTYHLEDGSDDEDFEDIDTDDLESNDDVDSEPSEEELDEIEDETDDTQGLEDMEEGDDQIVDE